MDIVPDYRGVAVEQMSTGISTAPARVAIERLERIKWDSAPSYVMAGHVPWAGQSAQEEVDQFYQCAILLSSRPELESMCRWWFWQECSFLRRKLQVHGAHLKQICKLGGITVRGSGNKTTYTVPWSLATIDELHNLHRPADELVTRAMSPFATPERIRQLVAQRWGPAGRMPLQPTTQEEVAQLLAYAEAQQAALLANMAALAAQIQ
jgi:hypothetical protein